jgi:hypothetical protein
VTDEVIGRLADEGAQTLERERRAKKARGQK